MQFRICCACKKWRQSYFSKNMCIFIFFLKNSILTLFLLDNFFFHLDSDIVSIKIISVKVWPSSLYFFFPEHFMQKVCLSLCRCFPFDAVARSKFGQGGRHLRQAEFQGKFQLNKNGDRNFIQVFRAWRLPDDLQERISQSKWLQDYVRIQ